MDAGSKIFSFVAFIVLGAVMRRFGILKPEGFSTVSGLLIYVTLPCVTFTGLNGMTLTGDSAIIALTGFLTNIVFFAAAMLGTARVRDPEARDFTRLNMTGFSIGPFAVPYVQAFLPESGLLAALMFDVGNSFMAAGGTYAAIDGMREKTSPMKMLKLVFSKLVRSAPILAFVFMVLLSLAGLRLPEPIEAVARVGAGANSLLSMIMIGESLSFAFGKDMLLKIGRLLAGRFMLQCALAWVCWHYLHLDPITKKALVLVAFSPVPAVNLVYTAALKGDLSLAANLSSMSIALSILTMSSAAILL